MTVHATLSAANVGTQLPTIVQDAGWDPAQPYAQAPPVLPSLELQPKPSLQPQPWPGPALKPSPSPHALTNAQLVSCMCPDDILLGKHCCHLQCQVVGQATPHINLGKLLQLTSLQARGPAHTPDTCKAKGTTQDVNERLDVCETVPTQHTRGLQRMARS